MTMTAAQTFPIHFQQFVYDNRLFSTGDRLLVAVSGGIDSLVLCHLLHSCGYPFSIAHCNFQLRSTESDEDEVFVKNTATQVNANIYTKRFDTEGYALKFKVSTQVAARELRYQWFEELRQIFDFQYILTAHHTSDNIETVLYNFAKGSGLRGLTGIKPQNGFIIRPLLWAKKEEILQYALLQQLIYREDSSNNSDKYARNYMRHHIIPAFKNLNHNFETTASEVINRLSEAQNLLDFFIQKIKNEICLTVDNQCFINKSMLFEYPSVSTILFEILKNSGFNTTQIGQILATEGERVGALFYSKTHRLLIDRNHFIVEKIEEDKTRKNLFVILEHEKQIQFDDCSLSFSYISSATMSLSKKSNIAQLDYDKLTFPLILRKWRTGDFFQPFGMKGKGQLLSDFLRSKKMSLFEKERVWVLETAKQEICWLVGFRLDERFRISTETKMCLKVELILNKIV